MREAGKMKIHYRMAVPRGLPLLVTLVITMGSTRNSDGVANIVEAITTAKAEDIPIGAIYRYVGIRINIAGYHSMESIPTTMI